MAKTVAAQTQGAALTLAFNAFDAQLKDYLAQRLASFANQLRADLGDEQLHNIESDAALLLSNLCEYLGLSPDQQSQVLGVSVAYIDVLEGNFASAEAFFDAAALIDA